MSINKKIDFYLSEHLADMMAEYKIADSSDLSDLNSEFQGLESRMDDLDKWKNEFSNRLIEGEKRMDRLKVKAGIQ
jgi:hypothetical protein